MDKSNYLNRLHLFLNAIDGANGSQIALTGGRSFNVLPVFNPEHPSALTGVRVSNLGTDGFLPLSVFEATLDLLLRSENQKAEKGSAVRGKLGDGSLPLDSVEGYVAREVYGKTAGDSVFRRITPISRILQAAGICENGRGYMRLIKNG